MLYRELSTGSEHGVRNRVLPVDNWLRHQGHSSDSGEYAGLDAATAYGFGNTGVPDSPEEADGFLVLPHDGRSRSADVMIKQPTSNIHRQKVYS
jgi:hypothetical protein